MQIKQFYPYSPRKADFEQLSYAFVARESLLEELVNSIREQADAEAIQHWMILGMRGMGKSHLIALLYHTVKNNADLNRRWVPLLMHEEEQSVFSLHTLFIRFLMQLGEEIAGSDKEKSRAIFDFLDSQRDENKKQGDILESVVAFLKDFVRETGKKLLVFMENSDDIFSRYISKKNDIKQFRNMLQHDNFMMLVATSPTFFDEISRPTAPLYQFFRIQNLRLLTYEEAVDLLNRWRQSDTQASEDNSPAIQFDKDDYKLRALFHLTGGNPRILLFLYMAIKGQDGIRSAVETFSKLLEEDLSNYYLSRLRDLSNQVQPIILALAESDRNLTQKEIAQKTFLPMKSIGTAMVRLEKDSQVRPVTEKKGKNTLYTLTDHLFRLWHQWRISAYNKEIIRAVVMCLAVWYKKQELEQWSVCDDITGMHCKEALKYRTTEHFKSLWEPLHKEGEAMIIKYLKNEDYQNFDKTLAVLQETGIESGPFLDKVARDLEKDGEVGNALKAVKRCLENNKEDKTSWVYLSRLYSKQKNFAEARAAAEKAIKIDSKDTEAWKWLGVAQGMQGNNVEAEMAFEKIVEIAPNDSNMLKVLGLLRGVQGKYVEAESAFEIAVSLDPEDVEAWKFLGLSRGEQKNHAGAELALKKAVELDPKNPEALKWLGIARKNQGNFVEAEKAYQRAVELSPKDTAIWKLLGAVWGLQENHVKMEVGFKRAVEIDPKDAEAWKFLGAAHGCQGKYAEAEESLERAIELSPKDAMVWELLGRACIIQKKYAGAETAFKKHIALNPFDKKGYGNLFEVLIVDSRVPDMLPMLDQSLSLKDAGIDFRAFIQFMRAFVFLYQQDRTPFLKNLNQAIAYLNELEEEKKHEVLGAVTEFLTDTLRKNNITIHRSYVAELRAISTELSSVFRPLDFVLDYFEVVFSPQKDKKAQADKARRILDSITDEIRKPVETMIEEIKGNL